MKAYKDALREFPAVKLVASKSANYARASAAEVMKSLLRLYPQIDGVLAANDPMAIGAAEALRAANRKSLVVGINASREVIEFVKSGEVLAAVTTMGLTKAASPLRLRFAICANNRPRKRSF